MKNPNLKFKQATKKNKRGKNSVNNERLVNKRSTKKQEADKQLKRIKKTLNLLSNFLFVLFIALCFLFLFKMKTHVVEGHSMYPTLNDRDYILIDKKKEIQRYDIITFVPKGKPKESYVKRVIGVPGDQIWLEKNGLFINHQIADETTIPDKGNLLEAVNLPDGTTKINLIGKEAYKELSSLQTIPTNHYFVLGDNRNQSNDSRYFGLVSEKQIEGVMTYRYFPIQKIGTVK